MGSVSGGCIEDDLIYRTQEEGMPVVCTGNLRVLLRYGISADQAHRFGLPCGGTVELVLESVSALSCLDELLLACEQRRSTERILDLNSGTVELHPGQRDGVTRHFM
ncbi:hypothetical protein [Undibacterium sp. RuTC16W]|uniref:hypothetical protein n=1 Tax=Undibacterium sp. RuTC16W TaxID=3413048 RepID=UPI003BF088DC